MQDDGKHPGDPLELHWDYTKQDLQRDLKKFDMARVSTRKKDSDWTLQELARNNNELREILFKVAHSNILK